MNIEKIKEKESIIQKQVSELSDIFWLNFSESDKSVEVDFFDFLEIAYNKLLLQWDIHNEIHPLVDFLNDVISSQYLSSYAYNSLNESHIHKIQSESVFKDFCVKLLMDADSEMQKTIHWSKWAVNNVLNETKAVSRLDVLFYWFQKFIKSKYSQSKLSTDDICYDICHYYLEKSDYHELLKLSEYWKNNFPETASYWYYAWVAHYFLDNNQVAKQHFTEFLIHSPGDIDTIWFLMIIELQEFWENVSGNQKWFERIAKKVEELNQEFPPEVNYNILYAGAVSNYNLWNFVEAAKLFEKVLEMDPEDEANFSSLVASYERSWQFQKALELLLSREEEYGNDEGFQQQLKRIQNKIKEEIL